MTAQEQEIYLERLYLAMERIHQIQSEHFGNEEFE